MTDDNLTAEIEKAYLESELDADPRSLCFTLHEAVAVCVAKIKHTKKMGRAAVEQAVEAERKEKEKRIASLWKAYTLVRDKLTRIEVVVNADAIKVRDGSTAAEREKLDRAHKLTLASIMTHADKRVLAERERCFTAVHDAPMSASRGDLLAAIRNEPYFLPRKSRRVLADAIRNESKPPTEPSRSASPILDGAVAWVESLVEPPRCGTCGACGGSGLSGELSYGGFAKPCPDCQKETSCGTCGSDDPRFMVSSNGVALRECPDPFHGTKKETP